MSNSSHGTTSVTPANAAEQRFHTQEAMPAPQICMQPSFGEIKPARSETKKSKSRPGERKSSRSGERIICIRNIKAAASKPTLKERSASIKRTTQSSLNRSREAFYKPEPLRTIDNALNVSQTKLPNADMPSSVKQSARLEQTDFNDT